MAGAADQFFKIDLVVAKGRQRLAARGLQRRREFTFVFNHPHAAATATPAGFEHHGVADACGELGAFRHVQRQGRCGGHHRHAGRHRRMARRHLVAQGAHHLGRGADPADAGGDHAFGEVGVLGQKAIAWVNRIHACLFGNAQDVVAIEVSGQWLFALADQITFVCLKTVQCLSVLLRVDRHGANPHFRSRPHHPNGDLGAVGDQDGTDGAVAHGGALRSGG